MNPNLSNSKTAVHYLFIPIGTEVSAKFRGAFCEAKVSECTQKLKYKAYISSTNEYVTCEIEDIELVKPPLLTSFVLPNYIEDHEVCPVDSIVKVKSSGLDGVVKKLIDASMYTVIFDDADQSQFKRKAIKLKGQKYFKDEENLNTMPLIKPENFSSPAVLNVSCSSSTGEESVEGTPRPQSRRSRGQKDSDDLVGPMLATFCSTSESESCLDEEDENFNAVSVAYVRQWIFDHLDQVVWIEKNKGLNFPGLVIDPWEADKKRDADNHVVVRSFRDNRLHSIPFKYVEDFDRSMRSDKPQLQAAIDQANAYLVDNVLPKGWIITYWQIYRDIVEYLQDDKVPQLVTSGQFSIEIGRLLFAVWRLGGFEIVTQLKSWPSVYKCVSRTSQNWDTSPSTVFLSKMKSEYKKYLLKYEPVFESRLVNNEDNPLPPIFRPDKSQVKGKSATELEIKTEPISAVSASMSDVLADVQNVSLRRVDDTVHVNFEDGKIYPAKILKVDTTRSIESGIYYIHYRNWNSRHDQWISEDMIADSTNLDESLLNEVKKESRREANGSKMSPQGGKTGEWPKLADGNIIGVMSPNAVAPIALGSSGSSAIEGEPKSSLSRMIAEKKSQILQSSSDSSARTPDGIGAVKSKSPILPLGSELSGKRSRSVSSSSDEDSAAKVVRTPRKLRRKANSRSSLNESPQFNATLDEEQISWGKNPEKVCSRKRTVSTAEVSNKEYLTEFANQRTVGRSPPKRRRVVKRSSLSESGKQSKGSSASPKKFLRSVSQTQCADESAADLDGETADLLRKQEDNDVECETIDVECETNDEGFSADEECESDDTIDMNKVQDQNLDEFQNHEQNLSAEISSKPTDLNPGFGLETVSPLKEKNGGKESYNYCVTQEEWNNFDTSKSSPILPEVTIDTNLVAKANLSMDSTDDTVPFSSPAAAENVTSPVKKRSDCGRNDQYGGTPGVPGRKMKRNGKSGQFRHGFFISDAEDSGTEEGTKDFKLFEEEEKYLQTYLNSIYKIENECEKLMDVSVLDEIADVDERILLAEQQMNLIQKRYKQLYREMEKLDNLKRRIRRKKKTQQNSFTDHTNKSKLVSATKQKAPTIKEESGTSVVMEAKAEKASEVGTNWKIENEVKRESPDLGSPSG